jgi:acetyl-CoA carboxylase carboxyl transferase subunit alpha
MISPLEFEQDIFELEAKILELTRMSQNSTVDMSHEIEKLSAKAQKALLHTYKNLTPWQKVLVARHENRPHFSDYIDELIDDFQELCGDRLGFEDQALRVGIGHFLGQPIMIMGHEKGHDIEGRIRHNFGMPKPEGYRKAKRLMEMADHFSLPIITLIDTAGAHPGLEAEERGQGEAIASCIDTLLKVNVPVISIITGEGGSGGAIALGVANKIFMLEHSIYSVISPEGCASILWRTAEKKEEAAAAQKLTAQDLKSLGVIDGIIPEPLGGAHRSPQSAVEAVGKVIAETLREQKKSLGNHLRDHRRQKFLKMGHLGVS